MYDLPSKGWIILWRWLYDSCQSLQVVHWLWLFFFTSVIMVITILTDWLRLGLDHFLVDLVHLKDGLPLYHLDQPRLFLWLDHYLWRPISLFLQCCFCNWLLHRVINDLFMVISIRIIIEIIMIHSWNPCWVKQNMVGFCSELKAFHALALCQFFHGVNDSLCYGNNGDLAPGNHSAHSKM